MKSKLRAYMKEAAVRRRAMMCGDQSPENHNDELEMKVARDAQRFWPGEPCRLCLGVGETICDGCSKIGGQPE